MLVIAIAAVYLTKEADNVLTKAQHDRASAWLTQWTTANNFRAVLCDTEESGIAILSDELATCVEETMGLPPRVFGFNVSIQTVRESRFWINPQSRILREHVATRYS